MKDKPGKSGPILTRVTLKPQEPEKIYVPAKKEIVRPEEKENTGSLTAEIIFSVILLASMCALRTVLIYAKNIGTEINSFSDLGNTIWISMGISIVVFGILRIFLRKPYFACLFVAVGSFLAVNFDWLINLMRLFMHSLKNEYFYATIGAFVLYLIIVLGFFFLLRLIYKKSFPGSIIVRILSVTFAGLVLFNVVTAFFTIGKNTSDKMQVAAVSDVAPVSTAKSTPEATAIPTSTETNGAVVTPTATSAAFGKPNVYFFILDEYSSFDMISKYYGYDNKVFNDFLNMEGFNVSKESYSTDNETEWSICDTVNLQYISRHFTKQQSIDHIANAPLFNALSGIGYSQFQFSFDTDHFNSINSLDTDTGEKDYNKIVNLYGDEDADQVVSDSSITDALTELLGNQNTDPNTQVDTSALNKWGFYPSNYIINTDGFKNNKLNDLADDELKIYDYFKNPSNYPSSSTPRVIYSYMLATHVPFLFNEYGGIIPYGDNRNWEDPSIYLNQYKFVTKNMIAILSAIIANDPNSIIVVMSDHGIRYHADCTLKHTFYITDKDSLRIFNAVYIKGQKYDIEGLSAINTWRYILSLYDGQNYSPIQDPVTKDSPAALKGIIPKPR